MGPTFSLTFFALSRSLKHGDPAALEDYQGGRDYDRFVSSIIFLTSRRCEASLTPKKKTTT